MTETPTAHDPPPGDAAQAVSPRARARLQDPLLEEALRFFALAAQEEGIPPEEAARVVRAQMRLSAGEPAARRLGEWFAELLRVRQEPAAAGAELRRSAAYTDRVYILLKVLEFRRDATPGEQRGEPPGAWRQLLGIGESDFRTVCAVGTLGVLPALPADASAAVRVLPVTDAGQPGALWLPVAGVQAMFLAVEDAFYVCRRSAHALRIGVQELPLDLFFRLREDEVVTLEDREITPSDLRHYFRQAARPQGENALHIQVTEHAITVSHEADGAGGLLVDLGQVTPRVEAHGLDALQVNGQTVSGLTPVWLGDRLLYHGHRLDLRRLVRYAHHDRFVFGEAGDVCTISNDPRAAIYLPDGAGVPPWSCRLEARGKGLLLHPGDCPHSVRVRGRLVKRPTPLHSGESIQIVGTRLLVEQAAGGTWTVVARDNKFSTVAVQGVTHRFADGNTALDDLSFELQRGDLVCVLGPSGCGKSTLLNVLNGSLRPGAGDVQFDGVSLATHAGLQARIGFVPQDDLLHENLTVRENLRFASRLRWAQEPGASLDALVETVLGEIDLREQGDARVGDALDKSLSGGQRKRVNIGLELVGAGSLLLLDEPTSGLSAGDTLKIVEVLRHRADQGNIVLVVAHQPSARALAAFDKVLVLDKGGRMAFYGSVKGCYRYFAAALPSTRRRAAAVASGAPPDPGIIFEALEQPRLHIDGSPAGERRYPPTYWQGRFRAVTAEYLPLPWRERVPTAPVRAARAPGSFWNRVKTLLRREALNKARGRAAWLTQLGSAALLGLAAACACRVRVPLRPYSYHNNQALLNYIFLTVIVCLFLSVSGSVQEIIRDRAVLLRERMLDIPFAAYLQSKFIVLFGVYACQLTLYLLAGAWLLEIPELLGAWWCFLALVGCVGLGLGLALSALPKLSERAAAALVPLVIIPQIILCGADPFPFPSMRHLKLRGGTGDDPPEVAQLMPSRWAFEGLVTLHRDLGFAHAWHEAKQELKGVEIVVLDQLPATEQKRTHPGAYAAQYAECARVYQERLGQPLTAERVAFYRRLYPEVPPTREKRNDFFYHQAGGRFDPEPKPAETRFPFTRRIANLEASTTGFDAAVLALFAVGFLGATGLIYRSSAFALHRRRPVHKASGKMGTKPAGSPR